MQKIFRFILFGLFLSFSLSAQQQDSIPEIVGDSIHVELSKRNVPDSILPDTLKDTVEIAVAAAAAQDTVKTAHNEHAAFQPNPQKAVIYALIFPGLGQVYNRKYWKLPMVYGGFLGCAYAISWNGEMYSEYKHATHDILDTDPATDYWLQFLPYGTKAEDISTSQMDWLKRTFKSKRDYYRRYRDLSYFITVGVYALWVLDAYVDAQLYDFDISPDLSMRIEPVFFDRTAFSSRSIGLQCSISF